MSCSSPRPGAVDEERTLDLDACIAAGTACMKSGATPIESFFPGTHAILIAPDKNPKDPKNPENGYVDLPLVPPSESATLTQIVVASNTRGAYVDTTRDLKVSIVGVDGAESHLHPVAGFTRTEVAEQSRTLPKTGATLHIEAVGGEGFEINYVIGRWNH